MNNALFKGLSLGAVCLASALAASASFAAGEDSLFGPIDFGHKSATKEKNVPQNPGGFTKFESSPGARSYLSQQPIGGMYLVENTIHNCKSTLHIAVDRIRGPEFENRINNAVIERHLTVRVLVNTPVDEVDEQPLQRLLRAGAEVKVTSTPILDPVLICDSDVVLRGVLEPYDKNRVSYGYSFTTATYDSNETAKPYEVMWQGMWGKASSLPMSTEPGNRHWELFGEQLKQQNQAVSDYEQQRVEREYGFKPSEKRGVFDTPFEFRTGTYGKSQPSASDGDGTHF